MTDTAQSPTLIRLLTMRISIVAGVAVLLMLAAFVAQYLADPEELVRMVLEAEAKCIAEAVAVANGNVPAQWAHYRDYPQAYGFRVFQKGLPPGKRLLAQVNDAAMPAMPASVPNKRDPILALNEEFGALSGPGGPRDHRGWMITHRVAVHGHGFWVQAVLRSDPAGLRWMMLGQGC